MAVQTQPVVDLEARHGHDAEISQETEGTKRLEDLGKQATEGPTCK